MLVSHPTLPARQLLPLYETLDIIPMGFAVVTPRQLAPSVERTRAGSRFRRLHLRRQIFIDKGGQIASSEGGCVLCAELRVIQSDSRHTRMLQTNLQRQWLASIRQTQHHHLLQPTFARVTGGETKKTHVRSIDRCMLTSARRGAQFECY